MNGLVASDGFACATVTFTLTVPGSGWLGVIVVICPGESTVKVAGLPSEGLTRGRTFVVPSTKSPAPMSRVGTFSILSAKIRLLAISPWSSSILGTRMLFWYVPRRPSPLEDSTGSNM